MKKALVLSLVLVFAGVGFAESKRGKPNFTQKLVGGKSVKCADGRDNDRDGRIDFPADPGCSSAADRTESPDPPPPPPPPPPDTDGDGVPDSSDACPTQPGPVSNNGCPLPPPPPPGLVSVDGGPNYYSQFANPLSDSPSWFPIGAWLRKAEVQTHIDAYTSFGMNLFVGVEAPEFTDEALIRQAGMRTLIQADERTRFDNIGSENAGWLHSDEVDMTHGPSTGYSFIANILAGLPSDNRARYANYGKGVLLWETDSEAERFVNDFQQIVSTDLYWFTDPNQSSMYAPPWLPEGAAGNWPLISGAAVKRAANYGYQIDRVRALDAMDGQRQPVWAFVELGWPFSEGASAGGRRILPAELRAAVWHSIIAGARGIIYFDHNFGPGTPGSTILGQGYADNRAMAVSVNAQIMSLAPVLNSPIDPVQRGSAGIRTLSKVHNGIYYIFAGSKGAAQNATITVPSGATATVLGEGRTRPISNNQFTDSFADGNAVHIYRIDG